MEYANEIKTLTECSVNGCSSDVEVENYSIFNILIF